MLAIIPVIVLIGGIFVGAFDDGLTTDSNNSKAQISTSQTNYSEQSNLTSKEY